MDGWKKGHIEVGAPPKKDISEDKNINISSLKKDFKNLRHTFGAHTNGSKCSKNYFKIFLSQNLELLELT